MQHLQIVLRDCANKHIYLNQYVHYINYKLSLIQYQQENDPAIT